MLAWILGPAPVSAAEDARRPVVVVVRDDSALESVSLPVLRQIYLGRRTSLGGQRIQCFDLPAGSPVRRGFGRSVLRQSERELRDYWVEQALRGGHLPPREVASPEAMVHEIARRRGAVGYLDWETFRALAPPGVRALALDAGGSILLPSHADWPIRYAPGAAAGAGAPRPERIEADAERGPDP